MVTRRLGMDLRGPLNDRTMIVAALSGTTACAAPFRPPSPFLLNAYRLVSVCGGRGIQRPCHWLVVVLWVGGAWRLVSVG
jgi:hypothetical protein